MPWTLADAVANEQDPFRRGVLSVFWMESNLMAALPWETINRLKVEMRRIARLSLTKSSWVAIDASLTTATVNLDTLEEEVFKLGRDVDIPRDLANLDGQFEDPSVINVEANLKAMAYEANDVIVNGPNVGPLQDADAHALTGLSVRAQQLSALSGLADAVVTATAGGVLFGPTASSANRHTVLDAIDQSFYFIDGHSPDWGVCNDSLLRALNSALRREGTLFAQTRDQFGRWVNELRGVPLYDAGLLFDQVTRIITNAENPTGGAADQTSLYFVKNGVASHCHGFEKEPLSVRDLGELQTAPRLRTRIEWLIGLAAWHTRGISRVQAIRATT